APSADARYASRTASAKRMSGLLLRRVGRGIEQPVHVHDEIAHQGIIDGALRAAFPRRIGGRIVRIDADDLELLQILEFRRVEYLQLAAEHQMEQLLRSCFGHVLILARFMRTPASL